jgi:death-on-curing protein
MTESNTIAQGLALTELFLIHELLIETFGGMRGVTEHGFGKLEAALAAPDVSMFGEDLYPTLVDKASALFYGLVRSHGFTDGNKRVALVALLMFLERHGARLAADQEELYEWTMAAATSATREMIAEWIANRLVLNDN